MPSAGKETTCFDKAVDLVARRAHFKRELERKLQTRGYGSGEIEAALARLEDLGYVNETATAEHYIAGRLRRGAYGPRRLVAELKERGVDGDLARRLVADQIVDEGELAGQAARRWLRGKGHRASAASLARHLERAGFAATHVFEQVRAFEADVEASSSDFDFAP